MKRVLLIDDLVSIGKRGGSVSLPILSSFSLEVVFVPLSLQYSSFTQSFNKDLSDTFDSYIKRFTEDMIHFDCIYYNITSISKVNEVIKFISNLKSNDTKVIGNLTNVKLSDISKSLLSLSNVIFTSLKSLYLNEEDLKDVEKALTDYILSLEDSSSLDMIICEGCAISALKECIALIERGKCDGEYIYHNKFDTSVNGLYDLLNSVIASNIFNNIKIKDAIRKGISYTQSVIEETYKSEDYNYYGLDFEKKA